MTALDTVKVGPAKALDAAGADPALQRMTVAEWLEHHIDHLTGLQKSTSPTTAATPRTTSTPFSVCSRLRRCRATTSRWCYQGRNPSIRTFYTGLNAG
jgi:hypothetical protein